MYKFSRKEEKKNAIFITRLCGGDDAPHQGRTRRYGTRLGADAPTPVWLILIYQTNIFMTTCCERIKKIDPCFRISYGNIVLNTIPRERGHNLPTTHICARARGGKRLPGVKMERKHDWIPYTWSERIIPGMCCNATRRRRISTIIIEKFYWRRIWWFRNRECRN